MTQAAHDVLLGQGLDQAAVILLGNEVAAVCVHTFLQNIADLSEVGAQGGQHSLSVFIGCTPGLDLRLLSGGAIAQLHPLPHGNRLRVAHVVDALLRLLFQKRVHKPA